MLISSILSTQHKVSRSQHLAAMTSVAINYICYKDRMIPFNIFFPEERHSLDVNRPGIYIYIYIYIYLYKIHIWHIHITDILAMVSKHDIFIHNLKKNSPIHYLKIACTAFSRVYIYLHTYLHRHKRTIWNRNGRLSSCDMNRIRAQASRGLT